MAPGGNSVAAFCRSGLGTGLFVLTTEEEPLRLVDGLGTRGSFGDEQESWGFMAEPPTWIGADALVARLDERNITRVAVPSGEQTTIVEGDRFLDPADDYPGGVGFAYWHP